MGPGEGLARLLDLALQRRRGGLLGEREGQLVGPRGLGLGMLLMRLRPLDGRLGLGLGLRDFLDVLERQHHGLARRVGLREFAPGVGAQVPVHLGRERLLVREEAIEHLPGILERLAEFEHLKDVRFLAYRVDRLRFRALSRSWKARASKLSVSGTTRCSPKPIGCAKPLGSASRS